MTAEKMDRQSDEMLEQIRSYNTQLDAMKKDVDELKRQPRTTPTAKPTAPDAANQTPQAPQSAPQLVDPDVKRGELPKEGKSGGIGPR